MCSNYIDVCTYVYVGIHIVVWNYWLLEAFYKLLINESGFCDQSGERRLLSLMDITS